MPRGENVTGASNSLRRITPPEWGTNEKRDIIEKKMVLMERVIHWWGPRIVNGVRQLEEGYQQVFMPAEIIEKKEKQGWYRVEDNFDVEDALRKEAKIMDADGNKQKRQTKRGPGRPKKED